MPRTAPAPAARGHRLLDHCLSGREPNNCRDQPRRPVVYRLQARQHVFQSLAFSPGLLPSPPVQSPRQGTSAAPRRKRKDCSPRPPRLSLFRAAADCRAGAVPPLPVRPDPKKKITQTAAIFYWKGFPLFTALRQARQLARLPPAFPFRASALPPVYYLFPSAHRSQSYTNHFISGP